MSINGSANTDFIRLQDGKLIHKRYSFGVVFYVIDMFAPYIGRYSPMKGGERWSCSIYRDAPVEAPVGWGAGEAHSHPVGAHRLTDGGEDERRRT